RSSCLARPPTGQCPRRPRRRRKRVRTRCHSRWPELSRRDSWLAGCSAASEGRGAAMATQTQERSSSRSSGNGRAPDAPTGLGVRSWFGVFKRTFAEFRADNLTDLAAALTYYGVLAIFPAIIALVSILGLVGHSATQPLIQNLGKLAPGLADKLCTIAIQNLQHSRGAAGIVFIIGIAGAIWSASGYIAAFMRASNTIYDIEEGRPFFITIPVRVIVPLVVLLLLAI